MLNPETYRFSRYVAPEYPRVAVQARIQGKVELRVTVQPETGEVTNVDAVSPWTLLQKSATVAAKQWRFEPDANGPGQVSATLDYSPRCR